MKYTQTIRDGIKFAFSPEVGELVLKGWTVAESLVELDLNIEANDDAGMAAQLNLAEFKDDYRKVTGSAPVATDEDAGGHKGWFHIINTIGAALPKEEALYVIFALRLAEHLVGKRFEIIFPQVRQDEEVFVGRLKMFCEARKKVTEKGGF